MNTWFLFYSLTCQNHWIGAQYRLRSSLTRQSAVTQRSINFTNIRKQPRNEERSGPGLLHSDPTTTYGHVNDGDNNGNYSSGNVKIIVIFIFFFLDCAVISVQASYYFQSSVSHNAITLLYLLSFLR